MISLLCSSELIAVTAATELRNLNAMRVIESRVGTSQVVALKHQRQGGCHYHNGHQSQSSNQEKKKKQQSE